MTLPAFLLAATLLSGSAAVSTPASDYPPNPEAVVRALYDRVSWSAGAAADWDKVREIFRKEAVFALRLTRDEHKMLDLDGFIREFVDFAKLEPVLKHGFQERVLKLKATVFGDIAHVVVLFEASLPGHKMAPQPGVDICQLVKKDGKWSIVSIVNEAVTKDRALPPELAP